MQFFAGLAFFAAGLCIAGAPVTFVVGIVLMLWGFILIFESAGE